METPIDNVPVSSLLSRYSVGKTHLYNVRLAAMDRAGLGTPIRYGGKAFVSPEQLRFLDSLHDWMRNNGADVEKFLSERYGIGSSEPQSSTSLTSTEETALALEPRDMMLLELFSGIVQQSKNTSCTLDNFDALEKACQNKWRLPTPKLAQLLELKTLRGDSIERYGFRCTRIKTQGRHDEWLIEKLED